MLIETGWLFRHLNEPAIRIVDMRSFKPVFERYQKIGSINNDSSCH